MYYLDRDMDVMNGLVMLTRAGMFCTVEKGALERPLILEVTLNIYLKHTFRIVEIRKARHEKDSAV